MKKMMLASVMALAIVMNVSAQEKKVAPPPPPPPPTKVEKAKFTPPVIKKDVKKPIKQAVPPAPPVKKD